MSKKTMEVNPKHPILTQFKKKAAPHKPDKTIKDLIWLLFHTALKQTVPDQSSCYMDLSFIEKVCIKNSEHVLVEYVMRAKAGYHYIATVAHFAAVSSTGTNVNVRHQSSWLALLADLAADPKNQLLVSNTWSQAQSEYQVGILFPLI